MNSSKLPIEWIDRIFKRLTEIYGSKFANFFGKPNDVDFEKTRWQSGLIGVTAEEIKHVLNLCKEGRISSPPNVIEFYHYCKGLRAPATQKKNPYTRTEAEQATGEKYIKLILEKLHGTIDSEGEATLSALDKQILGKQTDPPKGHWQDN